MQLNQILTGDCRELLPTLPDKFFTLAFADPPYWVGFDYGEKTDKEMEYIEPVWLVEQLRRVAQVVLITPGIDNLYNYPRPGWIGAWYKPGSTRRSRLAGFNIWEPILIYGKPGKRVYQDAVNLATAPNLTNDGDFHNCPKPEKLLKSLVEQFTEPGDSVLDPVSGSGTTCKAAYQLGRDYLGIEIDPTMAQLSRERILKSQPPLHSLTSACSRIANAPQFEGFGPEK